MNQEEALREKLMEKLTNYQRAIARLKEALVREVFFHSMPVE